MVLRPLLTRLVYAPGRPLFWLTVGALLLPLLAMTARAEEIGTLSWRLPDTGCDGQPFDMNRISGFRVYYARGSGRPDPEAPNGCYCPTRLDEYYPNSVDFGPQTMSDVDIRVDLPGTYYIAVVALYDGTKESCYSNEVTKEAKSLTPGTPTEFEISLSLPLRN